MLDLLQILYPNNVSGINWTFSNLMGNILNFYQICKALKGLIQKLNLIKFHYILIWLGFLVIKI